MPNERSTASSSPAAMPEITTRMARPTVRKKPSMMSGRYFAMTAALKKVATKCCQLVMAQAASSSHGRPPPAPPRPTVMAGLDPAIYRGTSVA